jgi:anti-sigma B factor antagonist
MGLVTRKLGDVVILDVRGDLVASSIDEFAIRQQVKAGLETGLKRWVVNFADVTFMDSSGFGELLSTFISARNAGGQLKLENIPAKVRLIFKITGLEGVFEIFNQEEAAVRSFFETRPPGK